MMVKDTARYRLVVISGPAQGTERRSEGTVTVGRDEGCELPVPDPSVSRRHVEFSEREGAVWAADLGSSNGTFVNEMPLRQQPLSNGDRIRVGDTEVLFLDERPEPAEPSTDKKQTRRTKSALMIGSSPGLRRVREQIGAVAETDATILLLGESGTGKELVARAIHNARGARSWVAVNAPALPESLVESELFGHERGAFTGADRRAEGAFSRAEGGTLFLDEVGELPLCCQAKLLRVLESNTFTRLGGTEELRTTARVVAATNRNLSLEVAAGRFREDLYYRLAGVSIELPPLRERPEDIADLVRYFVTVFGATARRPIDGVDPAALQELESRPWPGNVRELRNIVREAVLFATSATLGVADFKSAGQTSTARLEVVDGGLLASPDAVAQELNLQQNEKALLKSALEQTDGNKKAAAALLGIGRNTLYQKLKRFGLM